MRYSKSWNAYMCGSVCYPCVPCFHACALLQFVLTNWMFIFIVFVIRILHTTWPAAVTTVAMETCAVSELMALNRRERQTERRKRRIRN